MADMTLSADINADVSGFTSGVSKAESSLSGFQSKCRKAGDDAEGAGKKSESGGKGVKGFGDRCKAAASGASAFTSKVSALTVAAGNLIANLAGKAIGYVASLGSEMVEASDSANKFASTLEFAGIDTGTIDKLTKSTQAYADATVYDLADIRNATAQLAANGVSDYAQLAEAAGNLNAVAGGNADTFRSVAMVMTQTAGAGKLTTENWNQLTDAIPGASGALQQAMKDAGAFEGNFREAMEKGQISAEEFNAAVMKLGMTDVAKEAATSTATIEGAVGNLEAAIVGVGAQVIDAFKPFITGTINQATETITGIGTALGIVTDYATNWNSIAAEASAEMGSVATAGDMVSLMLQEIGMAFGLMPEQTAPARDAIAQLVDSAQVMAEAFLGAFQSVTPAFQTFAETVGPMILPLLQQLMGVATAMAPVFATITNSVLSAATQIAPLLVPLLQQIMTVMTAMAPIIQTVATTVIGIMTQIYSVVVPILTQIVTFIQTNMPLIQEIVTNAMTLIQEVVQAALNVIQTVWNYVWPAIQAVVETVMGVINGVITTVLGIIEGDWSEVWEGIQQVAESIWEGIQGVVEAAINLVSDIISDTLDSISSAWESAWDSIGSFLEDCWNGITDALESAVDGVVDFFTGLPDRILGALGDVGNLLWDAGTSIIDGLLGGLQSAAEGLFGWVGGIADTIASLKGPIPYDRKLLVPAGEAIMGGLLRGLTDGFREVRSEVSGMAGAIASDVSEGMSVPVRFDARGTAASVALSPSAPRSYSTGGGGRGTASVATTYNTYIDGRAVSSDGRLVSLIEELAAYTDRVSRAR